MADRKKQLQLTTAVVLMMTAICIPACTPAPIESQKLCPGQSTVQQAVSALKANWQNAPTFKATGKCRWQGYDDEQKKRKENFAIRIWAEPPDRFCLHGDVFFDASGIVLGSNAAHFWLVTRPKEIRGYYWGQSGSKLTAAQLLLGPQNLFEALGAITIDNTNTVLSATAGLDILTRLNPNGTVTKKIHIDTCTYQINKIEYFDDLGAPIATVELDDFKKLTDGFAVPRQIKITRIDPTGNNDVFEITINSAKQYAIKPKAHDLLFNRPDYADFEKVFKLDPATGSFIEEKF